jgi:hypothetical protein
MILTSKRLQISELQVLGQKISKSFIKFGPSSEFVESQEYGVFWYEFSSMKKLCSVCINSHQYTFIISLIILGPSNLLLGL